MHPYFVKRNGEMHHKLRYNNKPSFNVICYSDDLSGDEKEAFEERVKAASVNLGAKEYSVTFTNGLKEIVI